MTGELSILNVGAGDTKLTFDPTNPDEVKRSCDIVKDMIRRGFVLLIEVGNDEKGPIYRRAHDFDPETAEYIVAGTSADIKEQQTSEQKQTSPSKRGRKTASSRRTSKRIPASGAKAIAVAKTAGG